MVQSKLHLHPRPQTRARPVTSGAQLSEEGRGQLLQSNPEGWRLAVGTKGGGCRAPSCKGFTPGMGHLADRYRDVVHGTVGTGNMKRFANLYKVQNGKVSLLAMKTSETVKIPVKILSPQHLLLFMKRE